MGRGKRKLPAQMPQKLKTIRLHLGFNLEEMLVALGRNLSVNGHSDIKIFRSHILEFEKGNREPQLPVVLAYAQIANVTVESIIDDKLELPFIKP